MERREACKGGKDVSKKSAPSQSSAKCAGAPIKTQASHNARRTDAPSVNTTNQSAKAPRPSSSGGPSVCPEAVRTTYEQQVIKCGMETLNSVKILTH